MRRTAWFIHALDTDRGHEIVGEFERAAEEACYPYPPDVTWVKPGEGFEDVTLRKVRSWCLGNPDWAVLYVHTKGAYHPWPQNDQWRERMTGELLGNWRAHVQALECHDTSGQFWRSPEDEPGEVPWGPHYAGNFWWARSEYLARLPELPVLTGDEDRGLAETWISKGSPEAHALIRGYLVPVYKLAEKAEEERLERIRLGLPPLHRASPA